MKMMPPLGYQTRSQDGTAEGGISTAQTAGVTQLVLTAQLMSNASVALIASALMIEQVTYWLDYDADELVTESTPAEHY